jgi:hypothetical protein
VGCVVRASGPMVLVDYSARVFCTLLFTDFHSSKKKKKKNVISTPLNLRSMTRQLVWALFIY